MNEIDIFKSIYSIHKCLKEGNSDKILNAFSSGNKTMRCTNTYKRALKIIKAETQNKTVEDTRLYILFNAFYYKNVYDFFKPDFHFQVETEIQTFRRFKANLEEFFYKELEKIKGNSTLKEFMNNFILNNELFKMFLRGEIPIITFMLFDYFFNVRTFTPREEINRQIWNRFKIKYRTLKEFLNITENNIKLKDIKDKIHNIEGKINLEEIELAIKERQGRKRVKNSLLNKIKNRNKKINDINI